MNQPKEITLKLGKNSLVLDDLNRSYDSGTEFHIKLSGDQIAAILTKHPDIAYDMVKWGNDTDVGDRFFLALVKEITGQNWTRLKEMYGDDAYDAVTLQAKAKGYEIYPDYFEKNHEKLSQHP